MPDGDATTTQGQEPGNTQTTTGESAGTRSIDSFPEEAQDYIRRLRQESAGYRNELKGVNTRLKEFEDRDKTDQQRLAEQATTAEGRATAAELKLARYEIAATAGLPLKWAGRLQGNTPEELKTDADNLKKELNLGEGGSEAEGAGGSGFDGGVRRPVTRPKTMNGMLRQAAGR
jgi:hypothetical protein